MLLGVHISHQMRVIFVDKEKEQVEKACDCETENIEKYLKIDDFTFIPIEDSGSPTEGEIYYGFDAKLTCLSPPGGYVVCIPEHERFFFELMTIFRGNIYKMGQDTPLNILEGALVIISRRGKLKNIQKNSLLTFF